MSEKERDEKIALKLFDLETQFLKIGEAFRDLARLIMRGTS